MNILICHERFLFRFGADRVLIRLGQALLARGCRVTFMGNRYDPDVLTECASRVIQVPARGSYLDLNDFTAEWLRQNWDDCFDAGSAPDIVIAGGWPFLAAIPFFRQVCPHVVFFDQGVVPLDGYPHSVRSNLERLRELRRQYLPGCSLILANSEFTIRSQSVPDSGGQVPTHAVRLGADHLETSEWSAERLHLDHTSAAGVKLVRSLKRDGRKLIFCCGRWEPGCYKNSPAAFSILRQLTSTQPESTLVVLEQPGNVDIPSGFESRVACVGFPDDDELSQIMRECDVGLSVSLWEGFNLPLAEMQWLGRPALAFDLAAHPEVIAHPWYLCRDEQDMAAKAAALLGGGGPPASEVVAALDRFQSHFRWEHFSDDCWRALRRMVVAARSIVIVDTTNSTRDPANSGVIRVTRRLSRSLQQYCDPVFVVWDQAADRYVLPTQSEYDQLSRFNGPVRTEGGRLSPAADRRISLDEYLNGAGAASEWLLVPEIKGEAAFRRIREWARGRRLRVSAVFYDAIAVLRPELCDADIRANHGHYMQGLAECDLVLPISVFSSACLRDFWRESGVEPRAAVLPDVLPGEFGGISREESLGPVDGGPAIRILCVSTLEPRKNHRVLLEACLVLQRRHPDLDWSLTLVGNRYAGALDIAEYVERMAAQHSRIQWLGIVDDAALHRLYKEATFTVYASEIEGFGLPIMESIWHGKPCICSQEGVMAELAAGGGCLTADVRDPEALSKAMCRLASDRDFRSRLGAEARNRKVKTWDDYAQDLLMALHGQAHRFHATGPAPDWHDLLYPACLCDRWQMQDCERMAITAVLARLNPRCSIEVGTYWGGSLSLISQFSQVVFSIDIDASVAERFRHFQNVSFLTGDSGQVLPLLLQELAAVRVPLDFLLIDGDHSAEGIQRDVGAILSYVPKKPMFVMVHDSFNPGCREGLQNAGWTRSPYCHFVDLDFVSGRVIQHGGPTDGEMWGGLALAYFAPEPRLGDLRIDASASRLFEVARDGRTAAFRAGQGRA